jgi:hypothetical protein
VGIAATTLRRMPYVTDYGHAYHRDASCPKIAEGREEAVRQGAVPPDGGWGSPTIVGRRLAIQMKKHPCKGCYPDGDE